MSATLGDLNIGSMYAGSRKIAEAWLGNVKVFGSSSPGPSSTVKIGGRDYPFVQIGDQLWITENLDWKFDGLTFRVGVDGDELDELDDTETAQGAYYEYDESTYGVTGNKYGLLYNWHAVNLLSNLSILPSGWRVPSRQDFTDLATFLGGNRYAGEKLKAAPPVWNGLDEYEFNALPTGLWVYGFNGVDSQTNLWASESNGDNAYARYLVTGNSFYEQQLQKYYACSIRLCCSAP